MTQEQIKKLEQRISENYYIFGDKDYAYVQEMICELGTYKAANNDNMHYLKYKINKLYKAYRDKELDSIQLESVDENDTLYCMSNTMQYINDGVCAEVEIDFNYSDDSKSGYIKPNIKSSIHEQCKDGVTRITNIDSILNAPKATFSKKPELVYICIIWTSAKILPIVKIDFNESRILPLLDIESDCLYNSISNPFNINTSEIKTVVNNLDIKLMPIEAKANTILKYIQDDDIVEDDRGVITHTKSVISSDGFIVGDLNNDEDRAEYIKNIYIDEDDKENTMLIVNSHKAIMRNNKIYITDISNTKEFGLKPVSRDDIDRDFINFCNSLMSEYKENDKTSFGYYKSNNRQLYYVTENHCAGDIYSFEFINSRYVHMYIKTGTDLEFAVYDFIDKDPDKVETLISSYQSGTINSSVLRFENKNGYRFMKHILYNSGSYIITYSAPELAITCSVDYKTGEATIIDFKSVVYDKDPEFVYLRNNYGIPYKLYIKKKGDK